MRFRSKRNKVLLENGVVIKEHVSQAALAREALVLEYLYGEGLAVPALLGKDQHTLRLEYIEGPTYADLVEIMTLEQAEALAIWLAEYHNITGLLRGDCNLRNFLWSGGTCVGLDFEEPPTRGAREIDMGKILAFAATYNPPFTPKKAECSHFLLQAFVRTGGKPRVIKGAYLDEIIAMNSRRKNFAVHPHSAVLFFDGLV